MSKYGSCPHCYKDDWEKIPLFKTINPNREYVEGYGCDFVRIQSGNEYRCRGCHYRYGDAIRRIPNPLLITK